MTSNYQLFLILFAYYVFECFVSINKKGSLIGKNIVYDFLNRKGVFQFGKKLYLFAGFFSFGRNIFVLMPAALTLVDDGVLIDCLGSCEKFYYDSLENVSVEGSFLVLNGSLVDCGTARYAQYCKKMVNDCKTLDFKKRSDYIKKFYNKSSNVPEIFDVIKAYKSVSRFMSVIAFLIFFTVFIVFPVLVFRNYFEAVWINFLVVYLVLILFQIILGTYVLRKIYNASLLPIIGRSLGLLVSPLSAIRLVSHLSKDLLVQYHPAAVYVAANSKESSEKYVSKYLRYVCIKMQTEQDGNKKEYLAKENKILSRILEQIGFDSDKLWHEPEKESSEVVSFCPVCLEQYLKADAYCDDCRLMTHQYK
ncbi:MAG: hypothetical protein JXK07_11000 [Spirochaetes bacterium]|nr:hypothetical protein [Spirochaetota bacterium]MBN2772378.1 hypothetical protein [Spirochaetota bacterium]